MRKGAIYARYSSDNQRQESIDAQIHEIREYAKKNDIYVVKIYTDEAKTGTNDNRPGFLQMIDDAPGGSFDVILIHKLDRFARNRYDSAFYKRELKKAHIELISITERLDGSPESVILESLLEGMSEYYSKNLARETMKGLRENARSCKHNGGKPPLGLAVDPETKQYIPGPQKEVNTIRRIFELHAQGWGYGRITDELWSLGLNTREGKRFTKNSLYDILRNEKYIGTYLYNRSASKDESGKRNHHKAKSTEDIFRVEDAFPNIIDKELFWRVQKQMDTNKHAPGSHKAKVNYLLSGLVYCEDCGSAMVGNSGSYKTKTEVVRYSYYECGKRDREKDCDNPRIRKEILEDNVLTDLYAKVFLPERLAVLVDWVNEHRKSLIKDVDGEMLYLKKEMEETEKQIGNLVMAIATGAAFASLTDKLRELENKKTHLELRIKDVQSRSMLTQMSETLISDYLNQHRQAVIDKDIDECKKFIGKYVEKVVVSRDFIETFFRLDFLDIDGGGGAWHFKSKIPKYQSTKKHSKTKALHSPPAVLYFFYTKRQWLNKKRTYQDKMSEIGVGGR